MQYVHYGHQQFDSRFFKPVKNRRYTPKPIGGFWASPVTTRGSKWAELCRKEGYDGCDLKRSFQFNIPLTGKILRITRVNQLDALPKSAPDEYGIVYLDFEALAKEYDALEVLISEDNRLYYSLFGWDVDTLLVFNPDIIIR